MEAQLTPAPTPSGRARPSSLAGKACESCQAFSVRFDLQGPQLFVSTQLAIGSITEIESKSEVNKAYATCDLETRLKGEKPSVSHEIQIGRLSLSRASATYWSLSFFFLFLDIPSQRQLEATFHALRFVVVHYYFDCERFGTKSSCC